MVKGWLDLDGDGRRIERIIKLCETRIATMIELKDNDLILAYIDRLIKASNQKLAIQDMVIGFKQLRRLAEKQYAPELLHEKLISLK
jgi:hypothetical protein